VHFRRIFFFYRHLLPANALCFDVGANIGNKSEAMLETGAQVVAFEPNPLVLPELKARCRHFRNWTLVETALGEKAAIETLYARECHLQSSLTRAWEGKIVHGYPVPVVTLDAAIDTFGCPDYCKIDVEGWEFPVLKGLTRPIPLISFEFHLEEGNVAATLRCLEYLRHLGPATVNVSAAESPTFIFKTWHPLDGFGDHFPENVKDLITDHSYGDIYVRFCQPFPDSGR